MSATAPHPKATTKLATELSLAKAMPTMKTLFSLAILNFSTHGRQWRLCLFYQREQFEPQPTHPIFATGKIARRPQRAG
jgi:hypothetical protein